ncbi:hypothetical protein T01_5257 [Trichinella spiralis]|uniref:Uncharacterized protein n=1 Tax=Trichinella spiralis TaxID=6334 RepID=A0A0V0Z318_TRISP|nr:hypothetical protein T01_5257 [Trichinella spiralis]
MGVCTFWNALSTVSLFPRTPVSEKRCKGSTTSALFSRAALRMASIFFLDRWHFLSVNTMAKKRLLNVHFSVSDEFRRHEDD